MDEKEKENSSENITISKQVEKLASKSQFNSDYNQKIRTKVDDVTKREKYKEEVFKGKKTIEDAYTGDKLHFESKAAKAKYGKNNYTKHASDVDHTVPLEKVYKKAQYNPFLSEQDIKEAANIKQNYKVINAKTNRSKGAKSNTEYIKDNKNKIDQDQKTKMKLEEVKANVTVNTVLTVKTLKNATKVGGEAAVNGAKYEAAFSSARNLKEVLTGEKEVGDAVIDVGIDTAKAGAKSFCTDICTRMVESGATQISQKCTNAVLAEGAAKFLNSGGPGKAIIVVYEAGLSFKSYLDGELNEVELVLQLGEKGTGLAASFAVGAEGAALGAAGGALIGGIIGTIALPGGGTIAGAELGAQIGLITGEIVGSMVGYLLGTELYNVVKNFIAENSFDSEKTRRLNVLYTQLGDEICASRLALEENLKQIHFEQQQKIMNGFTNMHDAILENNYDKINSSLAEVCKCFEVNVAFEEQDEFDDFMLDNTISIRLGMKPGIDF